jgi:hypothetical protein
MPRAKKATKPTLTLCERMNLVESIQSVQAGNLDSTDEDVRALQEQVLASNAYAYALDRRLKALETDSSEMTACHNRMLDAMIQRIQALEHPPSWWERVLGWFV